jgi:hypothetical protein
MPPREQLVDEYIDRLEAELGDVPPDRREEIVSEIRSHIAEETARGGLSTEADLHNLLERLGDPAEIAAAARPAKTAHEPARAGGGQVGAIEVLAMVLTPIIWPVGVILYWLSPRWNTRDKLIATLLPPGGYPGVVYGLPLVLLLNMHSTSCYTVRDSQGNVIGGNCPTEGNQVLLGIIFYAVIVLVLLLPVLVGIYMARQLRKNPVEPG